MTTVDRPALVDHSAPCDHSAAFEAWRAQRTATLGEPLGWLSLTALHWLDDEPRTHGDLPGRWWAAADGAHVCADVADGLVLGAAPVDGEVVTTPAAGGDGTRIACGDRVVEVIERGGRYALRVRDPHAPLLAEFTGVPVFAFDERWVLPARFEPFEGEREVVGATVVEGLQQRHTAAGTVHFAVDGVPQSLLALRSAAGLSVLFTDATSGVSTTGTARRVTLPEPAADGSLVLDLNRAVNLPCAFTDHATCPLPLAGNRLAVAVEAGEKAPR